MKTLGDIIDQIFEGGRLYPQCTRGGDKCRVDGMDENCLRCGFHREMLKTAREVYGYRNKGIQPCKPGDKVFVCFYDYVDGGWGILDYEVEKVTKRGTLTVDGGFDRWTLDDQIDMFICFTREEAEAKLERLRALEYERISARTDRGFANEIPNSDRS